MSLARNKGPRKDGPQYGQGSPTQPRQVLEFVLWRMFVVCLTILQTGYLFDTDAAVAPAVAAEAPGELPIL